MGNNSVGNEVDYEKLIEQMGIVAITINDITYDILELIHRKKEAV